MADLNVDSYEIPINEKIYIKPTYVQNFNSIRSFQLLDIWSYSLMVLDALFS